MNQDEYDNLNKLIHPEMANFESSYYRRKCRLAGQKNVLHYSKLIKYIPLGDTAS